MKGFKRLAATLVFIFTLINTGSIAFAYNTQPIKIEGVEVYIDGTELETKESFYNFNGGTLVPMRELFEGLGTGLTWDASTQTISSRANGQVIELTINEKVAKINGVDVILSAEPKIINSHTYVPLRFIAEAFMYEVDWNDKHKFVSIIDMNDVNEMKGSKVYETSRFFQDNYLNMEIKDNESIMIRGRTDTDKTGWAFLLEGEHEKEIIKEFKEMESKNTYEDNFPLKSDLANGEYGASVYLQEGADPTYSGYYSEILLRSEGGEIFFPVSPLYAHNYLEFMKNAVLDPNNYLDLSIDHPEIKQLMTELANTITVDAISDYDKALKINNWVAQNIYYDYDSLKSGVRGKTDAYGTLQGKKSVCQGYAELTQELLRASGIPSRLTYGYALGVDSDGMSWHEIDHKEVNHVWNEAFVDGRWVILDTTWNSTNRYENGTFEKGAMKNRYFDVDLKFFSHTHKITMTEQ